jgi:NAD(P)-dependent dehydrogenase (short-subunit alcohol dehydrogenase family)
MTWDDGRPAESNIRYAVGTPWADLKERSRYRRRQQRIGLASAKRFVKEGAQVYITGHRQEKLDKALRAIGAGVTAAQDDVSAARRRQVSFWPRWKTYMRPFRSRGFLCPLHFSTPTRRYAYCERISAFMATAAPFCLAAVSGQPPLARKGRAFRREGLTAKARAERTIVLPILHRCNADFSKVLRTNVALDSVHRRPKAARSLSMSSPTSSAT